MRTQIRALLIGMAFCCISPPAFAEAELAGRWEGYQGNNRQVAVVLLFFADGSGTAEFRRSGKSKIGKAKISGVSMDGQNIRYQQHYTDAISDRVTGTTAKIELKLSSDGQRMIGKGENLSNGNSFDVDLEKKL